MAVPAAVLAAQETANFCFQFLQALFSEYMVEMGVLIQFRRQSPWQKQ
jgi:hypothetical protein